MAGEEYKLSKGTEWGKRLADHISDQRESEASAESLSEHTMSKVERQTLRILQDSQPAINYALSIARLDTNSLEIM